MPTPLPFAGQPAGPASTDSPRTGRRAADPLSETGVLRLLNELPDPQPVAAPVRTPAPTAVRRVAPVRRDVEATRPSVVAEPATAAVPCPRCGHRLGGDLTICPRCRTRLATSTREWQAVYQQASNFLARR